MPSYTIYVQADSQVHSTNTVYATARSGSGLFYDAGGVTLSVGQTLTGADYNCYETFLTFDTSAVVGGLSSAALIITLSASFAARTIEARTRTWIASTAAWVPGADIGGGGYPLLGSLAVSTTGVKTITLSSIERDTGFDMMLNDDYLRLGTVPTGLEYQSIDPIEAAGSSDPYLSIITVTPYSFGSIMS